MALFDDDGTGTVLSDLEDDDAIGRVLVSLPSFPSSVSRLAPLSILIALPLRCQVSSDRSHCLGSAAHPRSVDAFVALKACAYLDNAIHARLNTDPG